MAKEKKVVYQCSIGHERAKDALNLYFDNPKEELVDINLNTGGGLTFIFRDQLTDTSRPVVLNRQGLIEIIKFGLKGISENHE